MTDEEIAEAWIKDHSGLIGSYEYVKYDYDSMQQAFLAGLKAGRPQCHYMKDVNCYEDLPHNEDVYYAYVVNVGAYDKPTIERKLGSFAEFEFDVMAYHVIAWCEIPTFDKE